jgi:serine/threonine-protein kinase
VAAGRFVPGEVVADRYRIVGLLGRGGMGEVYRADDLKLDQAVALKFLPEALQGDPERRERFYGEVRLAREVAHPAVCRVYDVVEADGTPFLAMEYVDGEDLASLLRRIGHLPGPKALEIARQLCAGLAAAHQKGVLHRDLKPENVMIDGRGHVRVTDFGLAVAADAVERHDVRSGTPAYMSPEQRAGLEVTVRSEVYALGLVLFELFTGRKAFEASTLSELERRQRDEVPVPSDVVADIDPAVERVILRCLAWDPRERPPSALAVAAALPGGDPLAAALAAGETPSPQLVARGRGEALQPRTALVLLLCVAAALPILPWLAAPMHVPRLVPIEKSPAVLEDRARDLLRRIGYSEAPRDTARGLFVDGDYVRDVVRRDRSPRRWETFSAGPPVLQFWYRQSPRELASPQLLGRVHWTAPPQLHSGMAGVRMDMRGRLVELYSIPPQLDAASPVAAPEPDWRSLFAEAGLDLARFQAAAPQWTPISYGDSRRAWEGTHPERGELRLRVEAAAYRGRPVSFQVLPPWARPERMAAVRSSRAERAGEAIGTSLLLAVLLVAAFLAHRHVANGRGDLKGALRLAEYMVLTGIMAWLLWCDHVLGRDEVMLAVRGIGAMLLLGFVIWMLYLALEPYVRRRWPQTLISWARLLGGGWRDPLVGRDVLIGCAAAAPLAVFIYLLQRLCAWLGLPAYQPQWRALDTLLGPREVVAELLFGQANSVAGGLGFLLLLVLCRQLFRRLPVAVVAVLLVFSLPGALTVDLPLWFSIPVDMALNGVVAFVLVRFGLLASIVAIYVLNYLLVVPLTPDLSSWMAAPTLWAFGVVAALVVYGYRTALAGRSLFAGALPAD